MKQMDIINLVLCILNYFNALKDLLKKTFFIHYYNTYLKNNVDN